MDDKKAAKEFIARLKKYAHFWSGKNIEGNPAQRERLEGFLHSVLVVLDGMDDGGTGYQIYKDGKLINKNAMLHEMINDL